MRKIAVIAAGALLSTQLSAASDTTKVDEILITAKSQTKMIDTAGSYNVITKEDIASQNANSIADILQEYAGITTGVNAGSQLGRTVISLRGMDSKHSLILINGKRTSAPDALIGMSNFSYNWVPLNMIEKIEVVRGPMSSLYGSSALGGVINIITKKPEKDIFVNLSTRHSVRSGEGGNEQGYALNLGGKITDSLSAALSAEMIKTTPTKENKSDNFAKMEGQKNIGGSLDIWYDIDDTQQITLSAIKGNEIRDNIQYDKYYDIDRDHYSIGYEKRFANAINLNLKYYTSSLDAHSDNTSTLYTHKLDDKVANAELSIGAFDNNYIIAGVERRGEKYHKAYDLTPDKDFKNDIDYTSAYLQDEIELTDNLLVTLGLRYDKHENFGSELSPKAYFVYKLDDNNRIKGGYGHGFNAPSLTQNSSNYSLAYPYKPPFSFYEFLGNEDLKPESSDSFELGYEFNNNQTSFKATAFFTKVKDLIERKKIGVRTAGPITYEQQLYSNIDKSEIYGAEAEFEQTNIVSDLDLYLGYSYLHTKDKTTGKKLNYRPEHNVNLRVTAHLPYDIDSTIRASYIGKQQIGGEGVSGYTTLGLQLSKELTKGLKLAIGAENLTDKELADDYDYSIKRRLVYAKLDYSF